MTTKFQLACAIAAMFLIGSTGRGVGAENDIRNSVVKISVVKRPPDMDRPWFRQHLLEGSGTGVVVQGNLVLTAAHVVHYASQINVESYMSGVKFPATVVGVAHELDLACLKVEDESFFKNRIPVTFDSNLPDLQSEVNVYGYPIGGNGLAITKGIVSRVDFVELSEIQAPIAAKLNRFEPPSLRIQVDAALNPGNSGGPAVVGSQVIGIARYILGGAGNIGYLAASQEVESFLKGIAADGYKAKLRILDEWQPIENRALRSRLGLDGTKSGVVVRTPFLSSAEYPLKQWDVLERIGEHDIDNSGTVQVRDNLRLRFDYLLGQLARDDKVPMTILRGGTTMQIELPLVREPDLLMKKLNGKYPSYFVFGPLVFCRVSAEYVDASGPVWWMLWSQLNSPLIGRRNNLVNFPGEELVVLAGQLPHSSLRGYKRRYTQTLKTVDGVPIRSLAELIEVLRDSKGQSVTFAFNERDAETIVLDREESRAATPTILEDNGIPQQGSADALQVWQANAG